MFVGSGSTQRSSGSLSAREEGGCGGGGEREYAAGKDGGLLRSSLRPNDDVLRAL